MNSSWETLTLGEDGESILETGDGVLVRLIKLFNWFVSLKQSIRLKLVSAMERIILFMT